MADNTAQNGTATIAADEVTTLNGGASSGVLVQRVKPMFGADGSARDVSAAYPMPVDVDSERSISYYGRASTFRIPGRAGTTGQKIFSIFNAAALLVDIERITVDTVVTVVKAVTVLPPIIRLYRVSAAPTNGTAVTKVARDTALSSNASVTILQDASADGTSSASALTATLTTGNFCSQVFAPRLITAAGYEMLDTFAFLEGENQKITLRQNEGVVVMLNYTAATQNPITDMWLVDLKWTEYTLAT